MLGRGVGLGWLHREGYLNGSVAPSDAQREVRMSHSIDRKNAMGALDSSTMDEAKMRRKEKVIVKEMKAEHETIN